MNPERWRQIERIYNLALDRPLREREGFLDSRCHGDQSLRRELDRLLRRAESAATFLDEPAILVAPQLMGPRETKVEKLDAVLRHPPGHGWANCTALAA